MRVNVTEVRKHKGFSTLKDSNGNWYYTLEDVGKGWIDLTAQIMGSHTWVKKIHVERPANNELMKAFRERVRNEQGRN